jgi:pyruvoyl-dependent arginine decarboxylase
MSETQLDPARTYRPEASTGLDITIRSGSGSGRTLLSAFDHALQGAGVADFNLVTLSSVIPPASRIRSVEGVLPGGHGDLLFCVRAQAFAERAGDQAWAGLGWCTDETGGGLFVEHHGETEQSVVEQIELSLGDMNANRGGGYGEVQMALASAQSTGTPVCALVVAAYRVSSWHDPEEASAPPSGHDERHGESHQNGHHRPLVHQTAHPAEHTLDGRLLEGALASEPLGQLPLEDAAKAPGRADATPRITIAKELDYVTARRYYQLYCDTFGELDTFAVARQLLTESEFLAEMLDPRVNKYLAWDDEGRVIGMTTLTTDLSTVPWINPNYFAHHYPEQHARECVFYLGFTLVHPDYRGARIFQAMAELIAQRVLSVSGVVAWDLCLVNDERGLGGTGGKVLRKIAHVTIDAIDRQTYYAATLHGPLETSTPE